MSKQHPLFTHMLQGIQLKILPYYIILLNEHNDKWYFGVLILKTIFSCLYVHWSFCGSTHTLSIDFRTLKENTTDLAGMQVNKLNLGRIIFHLECSLNTGRITPKQQCDSHMHTIGIRCSTNFKFSPRTMQGRGQGGWDKLCPYFLLLFCLSLPVIKRPEQWQECEWTIYLMQICSIQPAFPV